MKRLSLSLQLALILAIAMVTSLVTVVVVDRVNEVYSAKNDYFGATDNLALTLLDLHAELSDEDFETAMTLAQSPSLWIQFGPWDGLHPMDMRDVDWERSLLTQGPLRNSLASAARVGSRTFRFRPKGPHPGPKLTRDAPGPLSIGNRPKLKLKPPPKDGEPYGWVVEPLEQDPNADVPPLPKDQRSPFALGNRPTTVYTVALQTEGSADWLVVYRLVRPTPLGGTISIATYALLAGLLVAGLSLFIGRRVMAPFHRVAQHAELLGRGERAPEVPVEGPRDVREIVTAFNAMNARVSQATDYQIGLLRSLGHDLKSPLASVKRLAGNVRPDETRAQIETRLDRVQSIVSSIMSFSRAVMREGELERTDMAAMLNSVVDEQADLGVDASATTPDRLLLTCRVNATERCLQNLVENAVKYGGGSVRAALFTDGDEAVIQIDDTGPGIPEDEIESAFQPFYRLADDEHGSGLGLAIARTIVIDQGGSLSLLNRTEGGLRAELRLPLERAVA